jgi:hypothetical protein
MTAQPIWTDPFDVTTEALVMLREQYRTWLDLILTTDNERHLAHIKLGLIDAALGDRRGAKLSPREGAITDARRAMVDARRAYASQLAFVEQCGGDLEGYIAKYGSAATPGHYGDGGEAIYAADQLALAQAEVNVRACESTYLAACRDSESNND